MEDAIFMQHISTTIEQRRQLDHERFMAFERDQKRIDEITDASERIALPMRNRFSYTIEADGELWFKGKCIKKILDESIDTAESVVMSNPRFAVELERRHIERQEYEDQKRLALSSDMDPDVLIVLSPLPDAVIAGVDLGAYDTERRKTMARVYLRTDDGIEATSLSLDLSDRSGLDAVAQQFGYTISDDASSEDILSMRFWAHSSELSEDPVTVVRKSYDSMLTRKYGGRWYAGRNDSQVLDAMDFIVTQPDLVSDHLAQIEYISRHRKGTDLTNALEDARYNFAAALTRRLRGDSDAATLSDAGSMARQNGEKYTGDCPTGNGMTAEQSLERLGLTRREWKEGTCQVCLQKGTVGECSVCKNCEDADNRGEDLARINAMSKRRKALAQRSVKQLLPKTELSAQGRGENDIQKIYGQFADSRKEIALGGQDVIVYDTRTGEIITKL